MPSQSLPRWCLKNNKLILLEPYLWKLEPASTSSRLLPPGLPHRPCCAPWPLGLSTLYVGDRDEKNPFCNTVRSVLGAACSSLGILLIAQ